MVKRILSMPILPFLCFLIFFLFFSTFSVHATEVITKGPYPALAAKDCTADMCTADPTKMTVLWQTHRTPGSCQVVWGNCSDNYPHGSGPVAENGSGQWEHQFSYTVAGLSAGVRTCYRLTCDGHVADGSFTTPPADNAGAVSFYAYGDTRGGTNKEDNSKQHYVYARLLTDMAAANGRQTACLHTGDFVMDGQKEKFWHKDHDNEFFVRKNPNMEFLSQLPLIGVLGNHEGYSGYDPAMGRAITDYGNFGQIFKKYFPYPFYLKGRDSFYYAVDYGPARFIVLDVNDREGDNGNSGLNYTAAGLVPGSPQYEWLKRVLALPTAKWKIVAVHNPLYAASSPRDRFRDSNVRDGLHALLRDNGVKLVLQGHNHYYSRSEKEGVTYLVLGGGGAKISRPEYTTGPSHPELKAARGVNCGPQQNAKCFHFARIDITGANSASITVRDSWGDNTAGYLIETFNVSK